MTPATSNDERRSRIVNNTIFFTQKFYMCLMNKSTKYPLSYEIESMSESGFFINNNTEYI